jgi:hypothetical protein
MNIRNIFKRKKKASSPYYGRGNHPLLAAPAKPLRDENEEVNRPRAASMPLIPAPLIIDWEQRRYEVARILVAQDRRSVVLGKLRASHRQIAANARALADAMIKELQTHPMQDHDEEGEKADD